MFFYRYCNDFCGLTELGEEIPSLLGEDEKM